MELNKFVKKTLQAWFIVLLTGMFLLPLFAEFFWAKPSAELVHWEYRWGDSPALANGQMAWAAEDRPEGWVPIDNPMNVPHNNGEKSLWFRAEAPWGEWEQPALKVRIYQTFELYGKGQLLYRFGDLADKGLNYQGTPSRLISLPYQALEGKIYFRIHSADSRIGFARQARLGSHSAFVFSLMKQETMRLVFGFFYMIIGLLCLYPYYRLGHPPFFLSGVFAFCFGVYTLCQTTLIYFFLDWPKFWNYVDLSSLHLGSVAIIAFMEQVFGKGFKGILRKLWQLLLVYAVLAIPSAILGWIPYMTVLFLCRLILLASIVVVLYLISRNAAKGNKEAKTILLGTFVFCLSGAFDIFVGMALPFREIPPVTYIGMLVFILALLSVMFRRLVALMARLRNSEKLSIAGQLAAGVAHEIRNPVTVLSGFLQIMREKKEDTRAVDLMLSEVERINRIVDDFLVLAKPGNSRFKPEDPRNILQEVLDLFESHAASSGVMIRVESEENLASVNCDKSQLKQVFLNVMKNAVESMPGGGNFHIELRNQGVDVLIRFTDEGSGIERNHMPKLGEPFYTTKADGTGLGLMISHSIIETHKGKIKLISKIREGTVVEIRLPAC